MGWATCAALLYLFHGLQARGKKNFPEKGPAIIAANHLSFLDPPILQVPTRTRVHFMAQGYLFRIPILGKLIRIYGAFPVESDTGSDAYRCALAVVKEGKIFGIHPEGGRGTDPVNLQPFREGVGRIAVRTGTPIYPATITGSGRAWPRGQALPRPGRIRVRFHPPIPVKKGRGREAAARVSDELRARIERGLWSSFRAFRRIDALFRGPAPGIRVQEILPFLLGFNGTPSIVALGAYALYLLGDIFVWRPARWLKFLRDASPLILLGVLAGMRGELPPLLAVTIPAGIQALWSGQETGNRWVLGCVSVSLLGWSEGWVFQALALTAFIAGHSLTSPRAPARSEVTLAYIASGLLIGFLGFESLQDAGLAVGLGVAAVILSRLVPSSSLSRQRRPPPPDRPGRSPRESRT